MNRNRYLFLLIGLALVVFLFIAYQYKQKNVQDITPTTTEDRLTIALVENATLSERVRCLEEMLRNCQEDKVSTTTISNEVVEETKSSNGPVIKIIDQKPKVKTEVKRTIVKTETKPVVKTETVKKVQKVETAPAIVYGAGNSASENYFPAYFYEPGTEGVKFCVRLGGDESRHLPHLAISSGNINAEANGISGYNWVILGPVSDLVGDWGITEDKTFFVSVKLVESFLRVEDNGIVELKAPATNWQPKVMTRFGDYYIFRVE